MVKLNKYRKHKIKTYAPGAKYTYEKVLTELLNIPKRVINTKIMRSIKRRAARGYTRHSKFWEDPENPPKRRGPRAKRYIGRKGKKKNSFKNHLLNEWVLGF